jgi:hypothetical protein
MINITDEAEYALCATCDVSSKRDNGIECEGCNEWYCLSCWKGPLYGKSPHFCGHLTTSEGTLVLIGDLLIYPFASDRAREVYQVSEMPKSFIKNMICYGSKIGDKEAKYIIIRPRLMNLVGHVEA